MKAQDSQPLSAQEIAERGEAIYRQKYERALLRTSKGMFVAINVRTELASLADSPTEAVRRGTAADPNGIFHLMRVGQAGAIDAGWYMSRRAS